MGLSINNETNHTFEFFLGQGWQTYLIANLIYFLGAFLLVSVLSAFYAFVLVLAIVLSAFPTYGTKTKQIINGLRWVVIGTILLDVTNTLLGQPTGYWHHPELVHEANLFPTFINAWLVCLSFGNGFGILFINIPDSIYSSCAMGINLLVFFILVSFIGASNWFFYEWRLGKARLFMVSC